MGVTIKFLYPRLLPLYLDQSLDGPALSMPPCLLCHLCRGPSISGDECGVSALKEEHPYGIHLTME